MFKKNNQFYKKYKLSWSHQKWWNSIENKKISKMGAKTKYKSKKSKN